MNVLLADDEPQLLMAVRRMFERKGHTVEVCSNGRGALEITAESAFDLLVLDWGLPDMDGIAVVSQLRAKGRVLPILMLTGRTSSEDLVIALDAGADDFLSKADLQADVLLARCEALARRAKYPRDQQRIDVRGMIIDEATRVVTVHGARVDLAASEFRVLALLAKNTGVVMSRRELGSHLWGDAAEVTDSALESVISRLRRKLGTEGERIKPVRLKGYVLTERTYPEGAGS